MSTAATATALGTTAAAIARKPFSKFTSHPTIDVRTEHLAEVRLGRIFLIVTSTGRARRMVPRAENPELYFCTHFTNVSRGPDVEWTALAALKSWREDRGSWQACELKG